jgi:hypothetical protein
MRIQVRIGPQHPLVSQSHESSPFDETKKTKALFYSRCGMIKIPPCSKALSAEQRPKFFGPSPAIVTSPYE